MKAIGYIRVSTDDQASNGVSLEAQEGSIRSYCKTYGLTLGEVIEDAGVSGKNLKRAGMTRLLGLIEQKEVEAVVIYAIDRAFRSQLDALLVMKNAEAKGVKFHSVTQHIDTDTAFGRAMVSILLAFGQMERELIGERTRDALRSTKGSNGGNVLLNYRQRTGKLVTGQAPFGYRWSGEEGDKDRELETDFEEMETVKLIRELAEFEQKPTQIKRTLEERGLTPRHKVNWHPTQIKRIIQADYY